MDSSADNEVPSSVIVTSLWLIPVECTLIDSIVNLIRLVAHLGLPRESDIGYCQLNINVSLFVPRGSHCR